LRHEKSPKMKVLVLVISSHDKPCYHGHRAVWRERWTLHPSFECKFLEMHSGPTGEHGDIFFVEGVESLHPGIFDKTLAAFSYYADKGYDYILRTNLSSLWLFDRFLPILQKMPKTNVYAGVISPVRRYVSGGGILMSPDVARLVVENQHLNTTNCVDDVDIGTILEALGVDPIEMSQCWHVSSTETIDTSHFHYYVKSVENRELEADTMRRIAAACGGGSGEDPGFQQSKAAPSFSAECAAKIKKMYNTALHTPSDINEHLPVLRNYASKCSHITECGVRFVVSSWAFAVGLLNRPGTRLVQVDPSNHPSIGVFGQMAAECGLDVLYLQASDLECPMEETDLLFIDTWHVYGQMKRELARWNRSVRKYIIMHDTTVDEWLGESLRGGGLNIQEESMTSGFPLSEICRGIWPAIEEFLQEHPEWSLEARFSHNNGLTILKRCEDNASL